MYDPGQAARPSCYKGSLDLQAAFLDGWPAGCLLGDFSKASDTARAIHK